MVKLACATFRVADAVFPVPPLLELTAPLVLLYVPGTALVTLALTVHELATVPPVSEIVPDPALAVAVPPQVLLKPLGVATTRLAGKLSVNATPFSGSALAAGLVMVKVSVELVFGAMLAGLNALAIEGGACTWTVACAVPPVPPSVDVTLPVVLTFEPAVVPVTFTLNEHEPLAAMVPPDRLITLVFCVAVIVPAPQEPLRPLGVEMIRPAGSVSLKATPDSATVAFGLLRVKLRLVEPFSAMLAAPNCF